MFRRSVRSVSARRGEERWIGRLLTLPTGVFSTKRRGAETRAATKPQAERQKRVAHTQNAAERSALRTRGLSARHTLHSSGIHRNAFSAATTKSTWQHILEKL